MRNNSLQCPKCGRKLPYDKNPHRNTDGTVSRVRRCPCGYSRFELVRTEVREMFEDKKEKGGFIRK